MDSQYVFRALCDYLRANGTVCGSGCYGGRCGRHKKMIQQRLCIKECGRATRSRTGYCRKCGSAQVDANHRLKRHERAMDEFIDEILSWEWPPPPEKKPCMCPDCGIETKHCAASARPG
jgi:hypothetical protein